MLFRVPQLVLFRMRTQPHNVCQERLPHAYDPEEGWRALEEFLVGYNNENFHGVNHHIVHNVFSMAFNIHGNYHLPKLA